MTTAMHETPALETPATQVTSQRNSRVKPGLTGDKLTKYNTLREMNAEKRSPDEKKLFETLSNEHNTLIQRDKAERVKTFKQLLRKALPDSKGNYSRSANLGLSFAAPVAKQLTEINKDTAKAIRDNSNERVIETISQMEAKKTDALDAMEFVFELANAINDSMDVPEIALYGQQIFAVRGTKTSDRNAMAAYAYTE